MIHKVNLQALGDVVRQVREVLFVLSRQDDAGHTTTAGLTKTRPDQFFTRLNQSLALDFAQLFCLSTESHKLFHLSLKNSELRYLHNDTLIFSTETIQPYK